MGDVLALANVSVRRAHDAGRGRNCQGRRGGRLGHPRPQQAEQDGTPPQIMAGDAPADGVADISARYSGDRHLRAAAADRPRRARRCRADPGRRATSGTSSYRLLRHPRAVAREQNAGLGYVTLLIELLRRWASDSPRGQRYPRSARRCASGPDPRGHSLTDPELMLLGRTGEPVLISVGARTSSGDWEKAGRRYGSAGSLLRDPLHRGDPTMFTVTSSCSASKSSRGRAGPSRSPLRRDLSQTLRAAPRARAARRPWSARAQP